MQRFPTWPVGDFVPHRKARLCTTGPTRQQRRACPPHAELQLQPLQGGYGRQRMWASVGWGGMSPIAGAVVATFGLKTAFAVYFVVVSLVFIPTCLLPINILSAPKKEDAGQPASPEGSDAKLGDTTVGPTSSEIEVKQVSS
jgi:hypothetical protein